MKTTYKAWLSPGNKIDWRGPSPKPFTKRLAVTVSITPAKPNATTLAAMEDARLGRNLSRTFSSAEEMIADMLKDD